MKKESISPWDILEGHKNAGPLNLSWFGAVRLERKPLKYEEQHRCVAVAACFHLLMQIGSISAESKSVFSGTNFPPRTFCKLTKSQSVQSRASPKPGYTGMVAIGWASGTKSWGGMLGFFTLVYVAATSHLAVIQWEPRAEEFLQPNNL